MTDKRKPSQPITKIRTKFGDGGRTSFRGLTLKKDDKLLEFVGKLDSACADIGQICVIPESTDFHKMLIRSMEVLFEIGAMTHSPIKGFQDNIANLDQYVLDVEQMIEKYIEENYLVPLRGFIFPEPHTANFHRARASVRSAERAAVHSDQIFAVPSLNVMSDLIFLVAWSKCDIHTKQWAGFSELS